MLTKRSQAAHRVFREGVLSANRDVMAQNIAGFVMREGLDGVDINWEYPSPRNTSAIPAADSGGAEKYYLFLHKLRSILPSYKSVSFAAPASFWYRHGPVTTKISRVVDYFVHMIYDPHGWVGGTYVAFFFKRD